SCADEVFKVLEVVGWTLSFAVAALGAYKLVAVLRNQHGCRPPLTFPIEDFAEVGVLREPSGYLLERHCLELLDKGIRRHACALLKVSCNGLAEMALRALEFRCKLIAHERPFLVTDHANKFARELREADGWIDHDRLHRR